MTDAPASRSWQRLQLLGPTFTAGQAREAGLWSRDLRYLADAGVTIEISRGVYRRAKAPETAHLDLIAVCMRAPRAVICDESALALHELIDEIPAAVHIAIRRGTRRPAISYPPVRVAQYAAATFDLGIEQFEAAAGEIVPVYSAARSVNDAMRHRHRIGETLALSALGRYLRRTGPAGVNELQQIARDLGTLELIRPAIEAVIA